MMNFLRKLFPGKPKINDYETFRSIWEPHKNWAQKVPGTAQEALHTLQEIKSLIDAEECERWRRERKLFLAHCCKNKLLHNAILELSEHLSYISPGSRVVGDPNQVAYLIPPRNAIGYAIYGAKNEPVTKELIEGRAKSIEVLRRKKKIIAVQSGNILRTEHCGSHHII